MWPWQFRPSDPDDLDWSDRPLSNTMAYFSIFFLPSWCSHEGHWTVRLMLRFWTSCACCLFYRGMAVGVLLSVLFGGALWGGLTWGPDVVNRVRGMW